MLNAKLALMHNLYGIVNNAMLLKVNQSEKKQFCTLAAGKDFAFYSFVVMSIDLQVNILFQSSLTFHFADRIKF